MTTFHVTPLGRTSYRVVLGHHSLIIDQPTSGGGDDEGPSAIGQPPAVDIKLSEQLPTAA
jgi:hypothetical protein